MKYNIYLSRGEDIEAVVEADDEETAEDIVYEAIATGTRPPGLINFWQSNQPWEIETEEVE